MILSLIFPFFIIQIALGQAIRLNVGGSYPIHLENSTNENPYVPSQYQTIVEAPSIANYFHNNISPYIDISFQFRIPNTSLEIGVGLTYENIVLTNELVEAKYILGKEFKNRMISPYFNLGTRLSNNYFYLLLGITLNQPEGSGIIPAGEMSQEELRTEVDYTSGAAFRIGCGVDFLLTDLLSINLASNIDFRTIKRGEVKFYAKDILLFEAKPIGDLKLSDNTISIIGTLSFYIDIF